MQNTLVHAQYVPMDSQWAVFVPTDVDALCTREVDTVISYTCE